MGAVDVPCGGFGDRDFDRRGLPLSISTVGGDTPTGASQGLSDLSNKQIFCHPLTILKIKSLSPASAESHQCEAKTDYRSHGKALAKELATSPAAARWRSSG